MAGRPRLRNGADSAWDWGQVDWQDCRLAAMVVHRLLVGGHLHAVHDVSDGGAIVAAAEMVLAADGVGLDLSVLPFMSAGVHDDAVDVLWDSAFAEGPGRYLVQADAADPEVFANRVESLAARLGEELGLPADDAGIECRWVGEVTNSGTLRCLGGVADERGDVLFESAAEELRAAFESTFEGW